MQIKIFAIIISVIIIAAIVIVICLRPNKEIENISNEKSEQSVHASRLKRHKFNPPEVNDLTSKNASHKEKNDIIKKIKEIIANDNYSDNFNLKTNDLEDFISEFEINFNIELPKRFENWEKDELQLTNLCNFGFHLLQNYGKNKNIICNEIAADIVKLIGKKFENITDYYNTNPFGLERSKWFNVSIDLTRFLAAYEYIGNDDAIKESICHNLIIEIIPAIDHGTKIGFDDIYSLHFAMTRLLTNYLYDNKNSYMKDLLLINKEKSISSLNVPVNESDEIRRGIYRDGSCISYTHIANYKYLQRHLHHRYFNFYEQICKVIGPKIGNLPKFVKKISEKLCHPQSPHVPFGLFDTEGYTVRTNWWDINGLNGVYILPFIGLGIFKNKKIMFSVRVQRPGIAACQLDNNNTGDYILGSIQLRRMYLTNQLYSRKLVWEELINNPGIISVIDATGLAKNLLNNSHIKNDAYYCNDVDPNNFIGRLSDDGGILFWFNKYTCTLIHSTITEVGIMTDNGLESYYIIHNHGPNTVQFCIQDQSSSNSSFNQRHGRQLTVLSEPDGFEGFLKFPPTDPTGPVSFSWKMVFDTKKTANLSYDPEERRVSFNYQSHSYKIFIKDESRYIVKRDDVKLFGGSSSSDPTHSMEIDGTVLKRNPITFMYS